MRILCIGDVVGSAGCRHLRQVLPGIKRLEKLEELANEFDGVERSFAIQAGREIRIIVRPEVVNDDQMTLLARDIAKKIEANLDYPGQIKVHLIRENRAIDYAK